MKNRDFGNGIRVVYLPANQAWAVMWHETVLRLFSARLDAFREAMSLTGVAVPE